MKILYTVHTVANDSVDAQVSYQGQNITAKVPVITVELVSDDPTQANPILRMRPESEAELAQWKPGARIVAIFAPEGDQPETSA